MTVVVLSPHLDDGALSVGATMHALTRRGVPVRLVTLFAGDPELSSRPSYWDARRGGDTAGDAALQRRAEDRTAAAVLGVDPVWLPFDDGAYISRRDPDVMWAQLAPHVADATAVIAPGYPLTHPDHRFATLFVLQRLDPAIPLLFYAELPYAALPSALAKSYLRSATAAPLRHELGTELQWARMHTSRADRAAKDQAIEAYVGEVVTLGYLARLSKLHDLLLQREMIGHLPGARLPGELLPLL